MAQKKSEEAQRLSHIDHERIMAYLYKQAEIQEGDPENIKKQKRKLKEKITAFETAHKVRSSGKFKKLTQQALPTLMDLAGLTYKDILEITNDPNGGRTKIRWGDGKDDKPGAEAKMMLLCDKLPSDTEREEVRKLVVAMLPDNIREILYEDAPSAIKAVKAGKPRQESFNELRQKIGKNNHTMMNRFVYAGIIDNTYHSTLPLHTYNEAMQIYDVSPHWLLGLGEDTCVLAKFGKTEAIMDAYCLLPTELKEVMLAVTKTLAKER